MVLFGFLLTNEALSEGPRIFQLHPLQKGKTTPPSKKFSVLGMMLKYI